MSRQRDAIWRQILARPQWDIIVIGGGITGAGIAREAARAGLRVLLVEQRDFAWGSSSRSSKLVHGGLRYLKQGQIGVTYHSVRERQNLLQAGDGLISPLGFLMPMYRGGFSDILYKLGLSVYDLMANRNRHRQYDRHDFALLAPRISGERLKGGFYFEDAQTDDARLVLRLLQEATLDGATVLNYVRAEQVIKDDNGQVWGIALRDTESDQPAELYAHVVVNATGAWADHLRTQVDGQNRIRPLRGSHLIFPAWRFPVAQAVSFAHPHDGRPVFVYPWEGVTLVGTTDLDHAEDLNCEPHITGEETAYLLAACNHEFPALGLKVEDVLSTYAGVRPVIGTGKADPSKETREHVVWLECGLLSVTGGKLTTFRMIALDALKKAQPLLPLTRDDIDALAQAPALNPVRTVTLPDKAQTLSEAERRRLIGRYGADAPELVEIAAPDELTVIPHTHTLWAELHWAACRELVVHLDDLLLRRTRLGLLLPEGGMQHIERIREIAAPHLDWDDARWDEEVARYQRLWRDHYSLPESIPDWRGYLVPKDTDHATAIPRNRIAAAAALLIVGAVIVPRLFRQADQA